MQGSETSWELLHAARQGGSEAQRQLVARYAPALRSYFRRRGVNEHDAEDLAQAAWIKLFETVLDTANPALGSFRGLLGTVAYRVWCSHMRHRSAKKRGGDVDHVGLEVEPSAKDVEDFDREWFARMLELALERLAAEHPSYFDAIDACLVRGVAHDAFAASEGCSQQTVSNRVFRGRKKLHAYLAEQVQRYARGPAQHQTEINILGRYLGW